MGAVSVRRVCCVFDLPPSITRSLYIPITSPPPFPPKVLSLIHKTHISLIQFIQTEVLSFPHKPWLQAGHPSSSNKLENFLHIDTKVVVSNALCEKLLECVPCPWLVLLIRRLDVNRLHGGGVAVRLATDGH